ncbi:MAG TPA: hypothetical protein VHL59_16865 [Thermoanaerobaculia bacterium]|nr:hypothetical protein [Thermoanaerobaculia bacterium]
MATCVLAAACTAARLVPWRNEPIGNEVNLAFTLERNLIDLTTVTLDGRPGRFILGTAAPRTIVDSGFGASARPVLQISEKETLRVSSAPLPLGGVADAIIGADAWSNRAITIDYRSGFVSFQKEGITPDLMTLYEFSAEPTINLTVDGRPVSAIVDTTSPDTLVLPGADARGTARVAIAGVDFGAVDVQYANVARPRIGNRLLSHFLVSIDYGRRVVGLWRDPRIPITAP